MAERSLYSQITKEPRLVNSFSPSPVAWPMLHDLQGASRNGRAKCVDHCGLIHEIWTHCFLNGTYLWIERVPSSDNISDLPSREDYVLVEELEDVLWRPPLVATHYVDVNHVC